MDRFLAQMGAKGHSAPSGGLARAGLRTPAKDGQQGSCPQVAGPCLSLHLFLQTEPGQAPSGPPASSVLIQSVTSL